MLESHGYYKPILVVPFRYFIILFAALKCDSFGFAWNLTHKNTPNQIYGLLTVRQSKNPINPQYLVESTYWPASSASIRQFVAIGVAASFQSFILNFFNRAKQYFDWFKNVPCLSWLTCSPRKQVSSLIMDISNSLYITSTNSSHNVLLFEPNMISSTYT